MEVIGDNKNSFRGVIRLLSSLIGVGSNKKRRKELEEKKSLLLAKRREGINYSHTLAINLEVTPLEHLPFGLFLHFHL